MASLTPDDVASMFSSAVSRGSVAAPRKVSRVDALELMIMAALCHQCGAHLELHRFTGAKAAKPQQWICAQCADF